MHPRWTKACQSRRGTLPRLRPRPSAGDRRQREAGSGLGHSTDWCSDSCIFHALAGLRWVKVLPTGFVDKGRDCHCSRRCRKLCLDLTECCLGLLWAPGLHHIDSTVLQAAAASAFMARASRCVIEVFLCLGRLQPSQNLRRP